MIGKSTSQEFYSRFFVPLPTDLPGSSRVTSLALGQACAWWRHQMETFSALLTLCEGNPPVTDGFPSQRPVTRSFDFFLWCAPEQTAERAVQMPVIWDCNGLTQCQYRSPGKIDTSSHRSTHNEFRWRFSWTAVECGTWMINYIQHEPVVCCISLFMLQYRVICGCKRDRWNYLSIPKLQRLHRWSLMMDK